jgi:hypothetical protein
MIIYVFKKQEHFLKTMKIVNYMGNIVRAGAGSFDKLEPEQNGPAPQHWVQHRFLKDVVTSMTIIFRYRYLKDVWQIWQTKNLPSWPSM